MKIQILYILNCPWCLKTKKLVRDALDELGIKEEVEEILVDSRQKAADYKFLCSPTIRINGRDIQEEISRGRCLSCEELANLLKKATDFVKQECTCGCRVYYFRNQKYPYPPKQMIKEAIRRALK